MRQPVPIRGRGYEEMRRRFRWPQLQRFNIGVACADAQPPTRLALIHRAPDGQTSHYTFGVATIEAEVMASYRLTQTDDHQEEAKRAFAEKRRPLFRGR